MKYLPFPTIDNLNEKLSCIDNGDLRIFGRVEVFSCKSTTQDRKLKHHIDSKYDSECYMEVVSPSSPGTLATKTSRKTVFYLIGTLNAVYPDYDFQDLKPEQFQKVIMKYAIIPLIYQNHHLLQC
jgi:hypothetical protein